MFFKLQSRLVLEANNRTYSNASYRSRLIIKEANNMSTETRLPDIPTFKCDCNSKVYREGLEPYLQ